ncbi:MAG TPA: methyltransferase domain-containing protein, partial [Nitrososphaera sp.]|nr:methyltransferase domain-containing protein [Nitrososphaera sp.]
MSSKQGSFSPEQFKAAQKSGWDTVAQGWKRWWSVFEQGGQILSDRLVELAKAKPGDRVLDIATGIGEPAITAAKKMQNKGQVTAFDLSPAMLAIAKE